MIALDARDSISKQCFNDIRSSPGKTRRNLLQTRGGSDEEVKVHSQYTSGTNQTILTIWNPGTADDSDVEVLDPLLRLLLEIVDSDATMSRVGNGGIRLVVSMAAAAIGGCGGSMGSGTELSPPPPPNDGNRSHSECPVAPAATEVSRKTWSWTGRPLVLGPE